MIEMVIVVTITVAGAILLGMLACFVDMTIYYGNDTIRYRNARSNLLRFMLILVCILLVGGSIAHSLLPISSNHNGTTEFKKE